MLADNNIFYEGIFLDFNVPEISEVGHLATTRGMVALTPEEKASMMRSIGCPVNRKIKTTMLETSFTKMCLLFQVRAGVGEEDTRGRAVGTANGFISGNYYVCGPCTIGQAVKAGGDFTPPFNITFVAHNIEDRRIVVRQIPSKPRRKRERSRQGATGRPRNKLTEAEVVSVWEMHNAGDTVLQIHEKMQGATGKGAIYNILNGLTWKPLWQKYRVV